MNTIKNYEQAVEFLFSRLNYERVNSGDFSASDLKLERMRQLLHSVEDPQIRRQTIHIAGTKGKGSTSLLLAGALQANGYKVGVFTSPHMVRFEERLCVNQELPLENQIVSLLNDLIEKTSNCKDVSPKLLESSTFFEIINVLAWMHFERMEVDFVVLEVGLGGLYDTTNLCEPLVTAITQIGLDHTQVLGNTIAEIAFQKAGIIKKNIPVVTGAQHPDARRVISEQAKKNDAKLLMIDKNLSYEISDSSSNDLQMINCFVGEKTYNKIPVSTDGEHQLQNTAVVIGILSELEETGIELSHEKTCLGLKKTSLPLRIEKVLEKPDVILDSAHNQVSIEALVNTLKHYKANEKILILGCSKEKDVLKIAKILKQIFSSVIITCYQSNPRAMLLDDLNAIVERVGFDSIQLAETPKVAWELAKESATSESLICVTGSFFLAAEFREMLKGSAN